MHWLSGASVAQKYWIKHVFFVYRLIVNRLFCLKSLSLTLCAHAFCHIDCTNMLIGLVYGFGYAWWRSNGCLVEWMDDLMVKVHFDPQNYFVFLCLVSRKWMDVSHSSWMDRKPREKKLLESNHLSLSMVVDHRLFVGGRIELNEFGWFWNCGRCTSAVNIADDISLFLWHGHRPLCLILTLFFWIEIFIRLARQFSVSRLPGIRFDFVIGQHSVIEMTVAHAASVLSPEKVKSSLIRILISRCVRIELSVVPYALCVAIACDSCLNKERHKPLKFDFFFFSFHFLQLFCDT